MSGPPCSERALGWTSQGLSGYKLAVGQMQELSPEWRDKFTAMSPLSSCSRELIPRASWTPAECGLRAVVQLDEPSLGTHHHWLVWCSGQRLLASDPTGLHVPGAEQPHELPSHGCF